MNHIDIRQATTDSPPLDELYTVPQACRHIPELRLNGKVPHINRIRRLMIATRMRTMMIHGRHHLCRRWVRAALGLDEPPEPPIIVPPDPSAENQERLVRDRISEAAERKRASELLGMSIA